MDCFRVQNGKSRSLIAKLNGLAGCEELEGRELMTAAPVQLDFVTYDVAGEAKTGREGEFHATVSNSGSAAADEIVSTSDHHLADVNDDVTNPGQRTGTSLNTPFHDWKMMVLLSNHSSRIRHFEMRSSWAFFSMFKSTFSHIVSP